MIAKSNTKGSKNENIKTIASRHTRHKSMLSNVSSHYKNFENNTCSKTIEDQHLHAKPIVTSKKKPKMYYYKKSKLSKDDDMNYMFGSKSTVKNSGEYSINQNFTIESIDAPKTTKRSLMKCK